MLHSLPLEQEVASVESQVADTIRIVNLIHKFRCKGHLTAQLDPLKRVAYGPWMADIGISSPWYFFGFSTSFGYTLPDCSHGGMIMGSNLALQVGQAPSLPSGRLQPSQDPGREGLLGRKCLAVERET